MSEAEALQEALRVLVGIAFASVLFVLACAAVGVIAFLVGAAASALRSL